MKNDVKKNGPMLSWTLRGCTRQRAVSEKRQREGGREGGREGEGEGEREREAGRQGGREGEPHVLRVEALGAIVVLRQRVQQRHNPRRQHPEPDQPHPQQVVDLPVARQRHAEHTDVRRLCGPAEVRPLVRHERLGLDLQLLQLRVGRQGWIELQRVMCLRAGSVPSQASKVRQHAGSRDANT